MDRGGVREVLEMILAERDDSQREHLMRFFKTGEGEYGEGDRFLGLRVPTTRGIVRKVYGSISLDEIPELLASEWHEVRLCGLLLLVEMMKRNLPGKRDSESVMAEKKSRRKAIAALYLANACRANNWDLVDLSCQYILGPFFRIDEGGRIDVLLELSASDNLWEQRISIVTTLDFIRAGMMEPTLRLADRLLGHSHDLIHKVIGWTLREVGKRDKGLLLSYLERNYVRMPRIALRYAIERLPEPQRQSWLQRK